VNSRNNGYWLASAGDDGSAAENFITAWIHGSALRLSEDDGEFNP